MTDPTFITTTRTLLELAQAAIAKALVLLPTEVVVTQEPVATPAIDVLSDLIKVGTRGKEPLYLLTYDTWKGFVEMPSTNPKQIVPRGANLPDDNREVKITSPAGWGKLSGGITGFDGMSQPLDFPASIPGYIAKHYPGDGRLYFEQIPPASGMAAPITDTTLPQPTGPQPDPGTDWILSHPDTLITD